MNIILFGASGMVGQGVLRECLSDADVQNVLIIGRSTSGRQHAKLREIVHADLADYSAIASQLSGYDACFFCLGVSSAGMREAEYSRITYDFTIAAAETLVKLNPGMTFIYVSGASTDSSERGGSMWARVKGKTENALLRLPFKAAYMFRPGAIQPMHGIKSKTRSYRILYGLMAPLMPALNAWFPKYVTTTEKLGRAMLRVAKVGAGRRGLERARIHPGLACR